jgi:hypothetical protein
MQKACGRASTPKIQLFKMGYAAFIEEDEIVESKR